MSESNSYPRRYLAAAQDSFSNSVPASVGLSQKQMARALPANNGLNNNDLQTSDPISSDLQLSKITPEFASKIVKYYVLPMFENSASAKVGRRLGQKPQKTVSTGGVYGELKLSEQLNETLGEVRNEVAHLTNTLEQEQERASYFQSELKSLKIRFNKNQQEKNLLKSQLYKSTSQLDKLREFVKTMRSNGETMWQMSNTNEKTRRRCQQELNLKSS